jgi:hypothetical protein
VIEYKIFAKVPDYTPEAQIISAIEMRLRKEGAEVKEDDDGLDFCRLQYRQLPRYIVFDSEKRD